MVENQTKMSQIMRLFLTYLKVVPSGGKFRGLSITLFSQEMEAAELSSEGLFSLAAAMAAEDFCSELFSTTTAQALALWQDTGRKLEAAKYNKIRKCKQTAECCKQTAEFRKQTAEF